jgi:Domain of unknown function (DUF5615)
VPDVVARVLVEAGHEVYLLRNVLPKKSVDSAVLDCATANALVLITCNRDDFIPLATFRIDRSDPAAVANFRMRQALAIVGIRRRFWTRRQHQLRVIESLIRSNAAGHL